MCNLRGAWPQRSLSLTLHFGRKCLSRQKTDSQTSWHHAKTPQLDNGAVCSCCLYCLTVVLCVCVFVPYIPCSINQTDFARVDGFVCLRGRDFSVGLFVETIHLWNPHTQPFSDPPADSNMLWSEFPGDAIVTQPVNICNPGAVWRGKMNYESVKVCHSEMCSHSLLLFLSL